MSFWSWTDCIFCRMYSYETKLPPIPSLYFYSSFSFSSFFSLFYSYVASLVKWLAFNHDCCHFFFRLTYGKYMEISTEHNSIKFPFRKQFKFVCARLFFFYFACMNIKFKSMWLRAVHRLFDWFHKNYVLMNLLVERKKRRKQHKHKLSACSGKSIFRLRNGWKKKTDNRNGNGMKEQKKRWNQ